MNIKSKSNLFSIFIHFGHEEIMAKIKAQKRKRSVAKKPVENDEIPLASTRKSDDPIPNKVNKANMKHFLFFVAESCTKFFN